MELQSLIERKIRQLQIGWYEMALLRKYGERLTEGSKYNPGETPEEFRARVLELYPDKDQQNYIRALIEIGRLAAYAPYAIIGFAQKIPNLDPRILKVYPPELNRHIIGKGLEDESLWQLAMDRKTADEAIRRCRSAAITIRLFGIREVISARKLAQKVILGQAGLNEIKDLPKSLKKWVLQQRFQHQLEHPNPKAAAQQTASLVLDLITTGSLGLHTGITAQTFENIAVYLGRPLVDPINLLSDVFYRSKLALDDMNIHPSVGDGAFECFDKTVDKPPVLST